jgi:hypothetical protein
MRGIVYHGDSGIIKGNTIKSIYSLTPTVSTNVYGIEVDSTKTEINGNVLYDIKASNLTVALVFGIYSNGNYNSVMNNRIEDIDNEIVGRAGVQGLYVGAAIDKSKVTNNYLYNCGLDTGIANTNGDLFLDSGTSTMTNINSWQ